MLFYNEKIFKRCFDRKGKYWYKNIKYIPLYFRLINHLVKYGYDELATWETFYWFTETMHSVLQRYRNGHHGTPVLIDNYPDNCDNDEKSKQLREQNRKMWNDIIDRMIELLDMMNEDSERYKTDEYAGFDGWIKKGESMGTAKDEFFKLFSEHFYDLWD